METSTMAMTNATATAVGAHHGAAALPKQIETNEGEGEGVAGHGSPPTLAQVHVAPSGVLALSHGLPLRHSGHKFPSTQLGFGLSTQMLRFAAIAHNPAPAPVM